MGKYALILTFGLILFTTILSSQGMETDRDTADSQADRQKTVLARQIAKSVFDRGISELRRDYRSGEEKYENLEIDLSSGPPVQHKGVSFQIQGSDPDGSGTLPAVGVLKSEKSGSGGVVSVTAAGYYEDARYRIKGDVIRDVKGFSAVSVKDDLNSVKGAGDKFKISGLDTNPVDQSDESDELDPGSGKGYDRPAMQFDDGGAADQADTEFDDDQVVGVNGEGDIVQENPLKVGPSNLAQEIRDNTTHSESQIRREISSGGSVGSKESPAVAAVDGDLKLSGNFHGVGALVVDGGFEMRGDAQWEGIVIVTDEGESGSGEGEGDDDNSDENDNENCNEEDDNKGHGNDCDNYDEDNPANSEGPPGNGGGPPGDENDDDEDEDDEGEDDESNSTPGPEVDIGGNAHVYGSLMMETGGNGSLAVRGSSRLQYSSSTLAVLADVLPTMDESVTLEVSNRSTKMFEPDS
jgi:hypothetical protein